MTAKSSTRRGPPFSALLPLLMLLPASSCAPGTPSADPKPSAGSSALASGSPQASEATDPYLNARLAMIRDDIESRGISDPDVLEAMRTVPRHKFVPPEFAGQAYADHPLPIGYGQTISQPCVVAWMTELLGLKPGERVLEIGTGSGYQAAVLAELGYAEVFTIEIVPELETLAEDRLKDLGYGRVRIKQGDGYYGWEEFAPFDAIIVTAAPDHLPAPLAAQLAVGGRLVIPIGPQGGYQTLWKFVDEGDGLKAYNIGSVIFVPLTGAGAEGEAPRM
ncbi:MAG: protein-L-isoaspartate(D-aspartate) O-methyltransferase [Anaerolineales bacterium]|nr:protein-L-isoaspartate(D-aspartate) O-methyltransferase [Anaerolineales bacterium]